MANVAVLSVNIDDAQYRAFVERVKQFRADEAEAPKAWGGVAGHVDEINKRFAEMADALAEQAGSSEKTKRNTKDAADSASTIGTAWGLVQVSARRFGGHVGGVTRDLAKWERAVTLFVGLTGAGSLYGLDRLAAAAAARRRRSAGAGVSTGELASFETNFGRLGDTGALVEGFNRAAIDVTARQPLQSLGVDARGKNAFRLFAEALPRVKELVDRTDPRLLGPTLGAYHLDQLGFDENQLRLLRRMSREEVAKMLADARPDADRFGIPDEIGRKWQDLEAQLTRAGNRVQTALADDLVNIAPGLTHVSDALVKLVDTMLARPEVKTDLDRVGAGLKSFADWLGSDAAQDKLKQVVERFRVSREDMARLEDWFSGNWTSFKRVLQGLGLARVGGMVAGPAGAAAGFVIGSTGFAPTHVEGAPGYGPDDRGEQYRRSAEEERRANRPDLAHRNAELKAFGRTPYASQEEYDKAEPVVRPAPAPISTRPGDATAYDRDIAGDLSASSQYSRLGEKITPEAFVVHHTGGRMTPQGVEDTLNQRHLGVQYTMDRDGKIYRLLPEGNRAAHILPSEVKGLDLSNSNTFGMEVIAKDDSDVTPAQVKAAVQFYKDLKAKYPSIHGAYGHGYLNPGHKQATEGKTIADAIRASENTPAPPTITPQQAGEAVGRAVPPAQRSLRTYMNPDAVHAAAPALHPGGGLTGMRSSVGAHPNAKPPAPPAVHVTDNTGGTSQIQVHH